MISVKAERSIASTIALRTCALSNGGLSRLTSRLAWVLVGSSSHCAHGACILRSFSAGAAISAVKVRSYWPAVKASIDVARLGMMRNSMASR